MISRKTLREAFAAIDRQTLVCSKIWMDLQTYKDMVWVPCEHCGGLRHPDHQHMPEDCDVHRVKQVMNS